MPRRDYGERVLAGLLMSLLFIVCGAVFLWLAAADPTELWTVSIVGASVLLLLAAMGISKLSTAS